MDVLLIEGLDLGIVVGQRVLGDRDDLLKSRRSTRCRGIEGAGFRVRGQVQDREQV